MPSIEEIEEQIGFRQKQLDNSSLIFETKGSAGANPIKLAQICAIWDFNMAILGWQDKPLGKLSVFLTQYQASIDTKYHKDFKDIKIAEEIERKRANRKGFSIVQSKE